MKFQKVCLTRSLNHDEKVKYMVWTNVMDQALGRILAQHAREGYMPDNSIKPATYAAVVTELRETFGLELTKDQVKNRVKTLRKQFAILKEILAQKGFKWDEVRKMVVAKDAVWKEYIKVNPDAKPFRAKVIENYDELCIIAGNGHPIACCPYDGILLDVDLKLENEVSEAEIDVETQIDDHLAKKLWWTEEMDTFLGKILAEQVKKGHKVGNILQTEAYEAAVMALNKNFGGDMTKDHIKNRLRTWKKQYSILNELLSFGGFKWDKTEKKVIGSEGLWNDYVKTHPDARAYRGRVIENYDNFLIIFGSASFTRTPRASNVVVHSLIFDHEQVKAIDASPTRCWSSLNMKWTRDMDRFLSMVLVKQVRLGNKSKLDNEFKPAAYDAAVSALREKFQLDFTRDHVKNRIRTWKKIYRNANELLEQDGFKWDKKQKMVFADDSTWNRYIKINPEARLLHGRVIENYDDLCIIIGNNDLIESSRNDTELELGWAVHNGFQAEFAWQNEDPSAEHERLWTDEMERCLIKKLIEHVKLGNKLETSFKPVAYADAVDALNRTFGLSFSSVDIKSWVKTWEKLYGLAKELLSYKGFKWDDKQKMVVASDSTWSEYVKINPDAEVLRGRCIKNYDGLSVVIGIDPVNQCCSIYGADDDVNICSYDDMLEELPPQIVGMNGAMSPDSISAGTQGSSEQTGAKPSSSWSKQASRKRRNSDAMLEIMSSMASNIGRIADALTGSNQSVCLDELFEMVQNIPGFDDDLILEACEFLASDDKRAKMFLKLNERLRKMWLLKRLRGQGR